MVRSNSDSLRFGVQTPPVAAHNTALIVGVSLLAAQLHNIFFYQAAIHTDRRQVPCFLTDLLLNAATAPHYEDKQ